MHVIFANILIRQNMFCTILPNITLANISSYTVYQLIH